MQLYVSVFIQSAIDAGQVEMFVWYPTLET